MKRGLTLVLVLALLLSSLLVYADPTLPGGAANREYKSVKEKTDAASTIIDSDTGGLNESGLRLWKSKAEERIDKINAVIEKIAPWIKPIYGMVPEISFLFFISLYLWLFVFVAMVLNLKELFEDRAKTYAFIFGIIAFVAFTLLRLHITIAKLIVFTINLLFVIGIAAGIIAIVLLIIFAFIAPALLRWAMFIGEEKVIKAHKDKLKGVVGAIEAMERTEKATEGS